MASLADKIREKICLKLKNCSVSLGVDGWTNTRHHKMYNLVIVHKGQAYFWASAETASNAADAILPMLKNAKQDLENRGIFVAALVGDNHSGVQSALQRFVQNFVHQSKNIWCRVSEDDAACLIVRCAAHSFSASSRRHCRHSVVASCSRCYPFPHLSCPIYV